MDVGIIVAVVALVGTVANGLITLRANRPGALERMSATITALTAELDTERNRRRIQQKHFDEVIIQMEKRMYDIERKERQLQKKYSAALEVIRKLLIQLEREGLKPDARLDTGEL